MAHPRGLLKKVRPPGAALTPWQSGKYGILPIARQGGACYVTPVLSLNYAERSRSLRKLSDFFIRMGRECVYFRYWKRWTIWWNRSHATFGSCNLAFLK